MALKINLGIRDSVSSSPVASYDRATMALGVSENAWNLNIIRSSDRTPSRIADAVWRPPL